MNFADGFSRQHAHFDRANNFLSVARRDAGGGFAIQAREQPVQMFGAARLQLFREAGRAILRSGPARRRVLRAAREDKGRCRRSGRAVCRARAHIFQRVERAAAIFSRGENFVRLDQIDQVMRNAALFGERHFRGADIEMPINLRGIADQNFAAELFGELDSQSRFSRSSGPEDDDEPREVAHPENFQ